MLSCDAQAVKTHLDTRKRDAEREEEKQERLRLRALRANDMEAYSRLVEETKNERLHFLLKQTDDYLRTLGAFARPRVCVRASRCA